MKSILDKNMISIKDAQRLLNVSRGVLYNMIESGQLSTQKIGHQIKIHEKSLKTLLKCSYKISAAQNSESLEGVTLSELKMIADWT